MAIAVPAVAIRIVPMVIIAAADDKYRFPGRDMPI